MASHRHAFFLWSPQAMHPAEAKMGGATRMTNTIDAKSMLNGFGSMAPDHDREASYRV